MPKKKAPAAKKTPAKKAPAKKSSAKKAVAKKMPTKTAAKNAVRRKTPSKKSPTTRGDSKSPAKQKPAHPAALRKVNAVSLGRPQVTGEEKLFLLFKDDYHARQVFDFLRVETVKELEQFTPQEIVHRLSQPIRQTVEGIRRRLAEKNRCLAGDEEYVLRYKEKAKA